MLKHIFILLYALPLFCLAQVKITGVVINNADKKPVPDASVFLSNATNGTKTAADGGFTVYDVKSGQYDLVVSCVGFEPYHQTIMVNSADINLPGIALLVKTMMLKEVSIRPDPNRWKNYNLFKDEFLGRSDNAKNCKILNPDVVNVSYDSKAKTLTANSDEFIEVENKALGYELHYLLSSFIMDNNARSVYYEGSVQFEPLKGKPGQQRRWEKNRLEAYTGSSEHFLRSCISNLMAAEGFTVYRLIRTPNKNRPPDSLINARRNYFRDKAASYASNVPDDSLRYWNERANMPKVTETLVSTPLSATDFIKKTDTKGLFAFGLKDCLYIRYTKKENMESTVSFKQPYAFFDRNGVIINPTSTINEGYWGYLRVAELLPVDYTPPVKK